jgi:hypothetical protein
MQPPPRPPFKEPFNWWGAAGCLTMLTLVGLGFFATDLAPSDAKVIGMVLFILTVLFLGLSDGDTHRE